MSDPDQGVSDEAEAAGASERGWQQLYQSEDWLAIWIGGFLLSACLCAVFVNRADHEGSFANPLTEWRAKPGSWSTNPIDSLFVSARTNLLPGLAGALVLALVLFGAGGTVMGEQFASFARGRVSMSGATSGSASPAPGAGETVRSYNC